jgi:hypothetical protein
MSEKTLRDIYGHHHPDSEWREQFYPPDAIIQANLIML